MEILSGGTVVDGTGAARFRADVGIEGDSIVAIGDLSALPGRRSDATGLFVTPGFIDLHTHSDTTILRVPQMSSTVRQGVTTEVCGNCGLQLGLAVNTPEFEMERRLSHWSGRFSWRSLGEFMARVEEMGTAANLAFLAGHGTLRKRVMGWERGAPDAAALRQMRDLLREALEEGAVGLSTGLEYPPGRYATVEEIAVLAEEVAAVDGLYATHLRDEADGLIEAVEEALEVARRSGVRLQLAHHKAENRPNWGKVQHTLARVDAARAAGIDVACDVYPYTAFMTGLGVRTLPAWMQEGSVEQVAERLRDSATRARVLAEMSRMAVDWEHLQIGVSPHDRSLQGRRVVEIARERGISPAEAVIDILAQATGVVAVITFAIAEEDLRTVLRHPLTSVGSDSGTRHADGPLAEDRIHPRGFGTFPRVLGRYVRETPVLTWEEAIHKMTGLPASRLSLARRGVLQVGAYADLVAFDPATVIDHATYEEPHRYPEGIRHVFVNGVAVVRDGKQTGALPGRVLRRGSR
ncbi:MAG: D-aminoacylase [Armatimonadetes bacterium]|nr:D-aminoacylase [Armatimonadota bacterium]